MKRSVFVLSTAALGLGLLVSGTPAGAQEEYKNLQILPKDTGKQELLQTMRAFTDALGVRCDFCHLERVPGDHNSMDWASDDLEHKQIARGMMKMTASINGDLLPEATGEHDGGVQCVTCHRGLPNPRTLDQVLLRTADRDGIETAIAKYRELRERFYGTGSYDFSTGSLGKVAQTLAQEKGDLAGALQIVDLNVEMNPENAEVFVMRAELQAANGDDVGAKASVEHALELDPENRHAKRMLQQMDGGK
ncbi:MAG: c-type cytochrome [Candidatus Eisenbacteria bacterium]|uniref:C-type cytochrome n=1 Tax=Eiseniibacteriota bacterium TaxID=2212470 RepID=A0A956SF44_UNCEI|nr:c-type cytochrome [Candidatus Eisenbacteria bacterium]